MESAFIISVKAAMTSMMAFSIVKNLKKMQSCNKSYFVLMS